MSELKPLPCPWCGELPSVEVKQKTTVYCGKCAVGPSLKAYTRSGAIEEWNSRRPAPQDAKAGSGEDVREVAGMLVDHIDMMAQSEEPKEADVKHLTGLSKMMRRVLEPKPTDAGSGDWPRDMKAPSFPIKRFQLQGKLGEVRLDQEPDGALCYYKDLLYFKGVAARAGLEISRLGGNNGLPIPPEHICPYHHPAIRAMEVQAAFLERMAKTLHRIVSHYGPNGAPGWNGMLDEGRTLLKEHQERSQK